MALPNDNRRQFLAIAGSAACLGAGLAAPATTMAATQTRVTGVRFHADNGRMKLHIDLDEVPESFKLFKLDNPQRVVIDLVNSRVATLLSRDLKARGTVRRVRYGKRNGGDLRIVLDVNGQPGAIDGRLYRFRGTSDVRLVVDMGMAPLTAEELPQDRNVTKLRDIVIAIDAGHGGRDPGALGHRQTREKDVTLKIARELERILKKQRGFRPVLIRNSDKYLALPARVRRARDSRADFLVSIHADAYPDKSARGSSVFALSTEGASSRAAALLAKTENQVDKLFGEIELNDPDETLSRVLVDLARNSVLEASIACGSSVLAKLSKVNVLHKAKVERAGFAVLRAPDVPSVLVETAFISNPREERKLRSRRHQRKIAAALADGVVEYFVANAPPNTVIAAGQAKKNG